MTVLPHHIDALSRSASLGLGDLRAVIPADCYEIRPLRAWWALTRVILTVALFTGLLVLAPVTGGWDLAWQLPLLVVLWLFQGWAMVGLFVLGHDCGHRAFSKRGWVNQLVGHLCMSPLSNALHTWTVTHDHHHAHTQRRGEEVDWAAHLKTAEEFAQTSWRTDPIIRAGYALPFGVFFWIISNTVRRGVLVRRQIGERKWQQERRRLLISNLIMLATATAIYGGLIAVGGLWMMLKLYGIGGFVATVTGALIITVQHANRHTLSYTAAGWTPLRGQLVSTFDVRFPRLLEWMWCDITIHIPHHISPRMPWYQLRKASAALKASHPEYYQSEAFGPQHVSWFAKTPFLRAIPEKGMYVIDLPENEHIAA